MRNLKLIILASAFIILALSCKKFSPYDPNPKPVLPPISAEGRNTFGLMFGSEVWTPNFYSASAILSANYPGILSNPRLHIVCLRKSTRTIGKIDDFTLEYFSSNISVGTYPLNTNNSKIVAIVKFPDNKEKEYQLEDTGTITFSRWDMGNKIASGTFSMTLKDATSGEKVSITEGRFDLKFGD
ncbi:hypothetical protein EZ428_18600 [Pedobacter frigiditerrae]|uniref:Uncharacterized protein n=1 Tax=Pedobacter frigiditerrae TaxID=2530452 RepID=A0A4R0MP95_9SPHI|nr:DUF6252 family protein [Pedobacter frigiditerrae]TCC88648.1 hypothetical protein EZ428_18600 [Pedobacter frigiditerrae]